MLETKIKVLLSTIPAGLFGFLLVLMVQSAPPPVLAQSGQETFFEEAVRSADTTGADSAQAATTGATNATEPSPGAESTAATTGPGTARQEGGGGGATAAAAALLRQGQISSSLSDIPGMENMQTAVIVPPRDDNAVLSGILTYQASRPVDLIVWNNVELENITAIPEEFGDLDNTFVNIGGKTFSLADVSSGPSGSVPFTGNAVEVVREDEPFIVTYSLNAFPGLANRVSDLQSLNSFNATAAEEGDDDDE